jgi:SHS2 domain-containing protein
MRYKILPHDELRFVAYGKTLEEAIQNSAFALFDTIAATKKLKNEKSFEISIKEQSLEDLVWSLLSELLWIIDAKQVFLKELKIEEFKKNKGFEIKAKAFGCDASQELGKRDVKGVSKNQLEIKKNRNWEIFVTLDI